MRAFSLLLLLAAVLSAPAEAQLVNENLLVQPPPGYRTDFQTTKDNMQMAEWVPANETVDNWTEMVTVQIFRGLKTTPEQFRDTIEKGWREACPGANVYPVGQGNERGYPVLIWSLACPRNPATGKPEMTWFKALAGNDSFYIVQKAFKFVPTRIRWRSGWVFFARWRCAIRAYPIAPVHRATNNARVGLGEAERARPRLGVNPVPSLGPGSKAKLRVLPFPRQKLRQPIQAVIPSVLNPPLIAASLSAADCSRVWIVMRVLPAASANVIVTSARGGRPPPQGLSSEAVLA